MLPIEYHRKDIRHIELVRPLWIELNEHHHAHARAFRDQYERWTFDDRKAYFETIAAAGRLRIDLAFDPAAGRYVGYCISSLSQEGTGDIESIFVEKACRSRGIGTALVKRALAWLDESGAVKIQVAVADGNEESFRFYEMFGFFPRKTVLEQKREPSQATRKLVSSRVEKTIQASGGVTSTRDNPEWSHRIDRLMKRHPIVDLDPRRRKEFQNECSKAGRIETCPKWVQDLVRAAERAK